MKKDKIIQRRIETTNIIETTTVGEIRRNRIRTVWNTIMDIITWVLVLFTIFLCLSAIYMKTFNKEKYTGFFGYGWGVVTSESMYPTLKTNDVIIYKEVDPKTLKADEYSGDIIVYKRRDSDKEVLVVHRLVEISNGYFITQGDNTTIKDQPFYGDKVVGKCLTYIPFIGIINKVITSKYAIIFAIMFILFLIVSEIISVERGKRKIEKEITHTRTQQKAFRCFFN